MWKLFTLVIIGGFFFYSSYVMRGYISPKPHTLDDDTIRITVQMGGTPAATPKVNLQYDIVDIIDHTNTITSHKKHNEFTAIANSPKNTETNVDSKIIDTYIEHVSAALILLETEEAHQLAQINPEAWEHSKPAITKNKTSIYNPIVESNKLEMTMRINGRNAGIVNVYQGKNSTFLPAKEIFNYLDFNTTLEVDNGRIYGWDPEALRWFMIDALSNEITWKQKIYRYNTSQTAIANDNLYIDVDLLERYFAINLDVDLSVLTVNYSTVPNVINRTILAARRPKTQLFNSTITDVEIEGKPAVFSTKTVSKTTKAPPASTSYTKPDARSQNSDNYLVFELGVNDLIYDDLIDIYQDGNRFYIPIGQFFEAMNFPITIKNNNAEGWYLKEENTFSLNTKTRSVTSGTFTKILNERDFFVTEDDIYLLSTELSMMFPLSLKINFNHQRVELAMAELLPFQQKDKREKYRQLWLSNRVTKTYDIVEPGNAWDSLPFADISTSIETDYSNDDGVSTAFETSAKITTTAGPFDTDIFLSASGDGFNEFRIKARSYNAEGNLFGIQNLSTFEAGDIESLSIDLISQRSIGRGVFVSNRPLGRNSTFDTTTLSGDSMPGWEVELYSNTTLLDFQVVGEDGRYSFTDVPIYYGNNLVRLVFYGPHGEVREKNQRFNIDDSILKAGTFYYQAGANEQNKSLFAVGQGAEKTAFNIASEIEYGITDNLTGAYGIAFTELEDDSQHMYQSFSLTTMLLDDIIARWNTVHDVTSGGWASRLRANTRLGSTNIRLEHAQFNHFVSALNIGDSDQTKSLSTVTANGTFSLPFFSRAAYTVGTEHKRFDSGKYTSAVQSRLTKSAFGLTFSNQLDIDFLHNGNKKISGSATVTGRYNKTRLRLDTGYDLFEPNTFKDARFSVSKKIFSNFDANMVVTQSFVGERTINATGSLNWKNENYRVSTDIVADDKKNVTLGVSLSFALYQDPRTSEWKMTNKTVSSTGAVSARTFLDSNHNNVFDEGEEIIPNVMIRSNGRSHKANAQGIAFFGGLPADTYTNVTIDEGSFDDPYLYAPTEGYTVHARAGSTTLLEFPVVESSEIEGSVFFGNRSVSDLTLYLLTRDGKKVAEIKTEYDGFYIFERVAVGNYTIIVADKELTELGLTYPNQVEISVDEGGEVFTSDDIKLEKKERIEVSRN